MKERPILFSGPMVRAILEGRKTQTRRVVKLGPWGNSTQQDIHRHFSICARTNDGGWMWTNGGRQPEGQELEGPGKLCPYGQPGDRLWVRESFCLEGSNDYALEESRYPRDGRPVRPNNDEDDSTGWAVPWYRATDGEPNIVPDDLPDSSDDRTRWKPSIHMPRWASRITLEVTEVRVERVQDISEEDAQAEGVHQRDGMNVAVVPHPMGGDQVEATFPCFPHRKAFERLWDSINGERPGCDWASNPWVWAVSFKRVNASLRAEGKKGGE